MFSFWQNNGGPILGSSKESAAMLYKKQSRGMRCMTILRDERNARE